MLLDEMLHLLSVCAGTMSKHKKAVKFTKIKLKR